MRINRKKIKFCGGNDQKIYYESFDNYQEFIDTIISRQPNAYKKINEWIDGNEDFTGVKSFDEAKGLLLNGWSKEVENLKNAFNKELSSIERKSRIKTFANVQGFMPIVPHAIMRLPNSMIDIRMESAKSKILKFMIIIDRACKNSVEDIIEKMSKQLAVISSIEKSGKYRCRIEALFNSFGDEYDRNLNYASCSVMVKRESQPFDIKRLAYPIIHPSMLRALMFAWEGSLPMNKNEYHVCGLGKSFEHWKDGAKKEIITALTDENEKTIVVDLFTDLEEELKKGGIK